MTAVPKLNPSRHLAAVLLGLLALVWAPIPFWSSVNFRAVYAIKSVGLEWGWLAWWLIVAGTLLFGALFPCRACRFWGLSLSAVGWAAFACVYIPDLVYSPSMMTAVVCAAMSVIILISDVRRKPRVLDCD